jgi:hypothetical protein
MWRLCLLIVPLASSGCLPADTRPPPAQVTVTVSSGTFTLSNFPAAATADGYAIYVERLLVNLGEVQVGNEDGSGSCNEYSNPNYTRLFDFKQVDAPRELGIAYATGACPFGFLVRAPNDSTVEDRGTAPGDLELMRTPGSDPEVTDVGVSVYVEGEAVRDDQTFYFAWPFRAGIGYADCGVPDGAGGVAKGLELTSGEKTGVNLEIHAESFFEDTSGTSLPRFSPYALADANGDGHIDLAELWNVPLSSAIALGFKLPTSDATGVSVEPLCTNDQGAFVEYKTLGEYVYCLLLPRVVRFEGTGSCRIINGRFTD